MSAPGQYFDDDYDSLVWALVQQESGGDYTASNPSGATGAYQVLASNVAEWSREALGHSVTPGTYASQPRVQDQVAQYQLLKYWDSVAKYTQGPGGTTDVYMTDAQFQAAVLAVAHKWNPDADASYGQQILARAVKDRKSQLGPDHNQQIFFGLPSVAAVSKWKLPPDALTVAPLGRHYATKPGSWTASSGKPIGDPPAGTVAYHPPHRPSMVDPQVTNEQPLGVWTQATWVAIVHWCQAYNDTAPKGSTGASFYQDWVKDNPNVYPRNSNNALFLRDIFRSLVQVQPKGGISIPDTGEAVPGIGPLGLGDLWALLGKIFGALTSASFWERLGLGLLGAVLLYFVVTRVLKGGGGSSGGGGVKVVPIPV